MIGETILYGCCPPRWLRHVIPWKAIDFIERHSGLCRCGIVMWKLGYDWTWDTPSPSCFDGFGGACYCGKYLREEWEKP